MLKIAIVILMLALVASLGSGFYYLMVDQGDKTQRRTLHSLGLRLALGDLAEEPGDDQREADRHDDRDHDRDARCWR